MVCIVEQHKSKVTMFQQFLYSKTVYVAVLLYCHYCSRKTYICTYRRMCTLLFIFTTSKSKLTYNYPLPSFVFLVCIYAHTIFSYSLTVVVYSIDVLMHQFPFSLVVHDTNSFFMITRHYLYSGKAI